MTRPHFLGTDASQSPLVPDLLAAARALARTEGVAGGVASARYGTRVVVNAAGVPLEMLGEGHFVEVADYDPHTDQTLCLGPLAPHAYAPLHALVYRAKREVNAIVQAEVAPGRSLTADVPRVERGATTLESAMGVLRALRDADAVVLDGKHVIATGVDAKRALSRAQEVVGVGANGA